MGVIGTVEFEGVISAKWHRARDELTRMESLQDSLAAIEERLRRLSNLENNDES